MVLLIDGEVITEYTDPDKLMSPDLWNKSKAFAERKPETVYKRQKCLYVGQRELAVLKKDNDMFEFFGSEDATTCHVALLREHVTGTSGVVHVDSDEDNQLHDLVATIRFYDMALPPGAERGEQDEEHPDCEDYQADFDLYLVGGFSDERNISRNISDSIFNYIIKAKSTRFHLKLFCAGSMNTSFTEPDTVARPRHYGAAIRVDNGTVFPAVFHDHGPDTDIRSARMHSFTARGALKLLDPETGKIVIPPFNYRPIRNCKYWLEMEDRELLNSMSTSPKVEPARFCEDLRALFRRMISDPRPMETIFQHGKREYIRDPDTGDWELVDAAKYRSGSVAARSEFSVRDFIRDAKTDKM